MVKPDGVERGFVGKIISRFEKKGLTIEKMEMMKPDINLLKHHYAEHQGKDFFDGLIKYMSRGRVVAMMIGGPSLPPSQIVPLVRQMIGATRSAFPGTIRGDWSCHQNENLVHASDSLSSAQRELNMWFENRNIICDMCKDTDMDTDVHMCIICKKYQCDDCITDYVSMWSCENCGMDPICIDCKPIPTDFTCPHCYHVMGSDDDPKDPEDGSPEDPDDGSSSSSDEPEDPKDSDFSPNDSEDSSEGSEDSSEGSSEGSEDSSEGSSLKDAHLTTHDPYWLWPSFTK